MPKNKFDPPTVHNCSSKNQFRISNSTQTEPMEPSTTTPATTTTETVEVPSYNSSSKLFSVAFVSSTVLLLCSLLTFIIQVASYFAFDNYILLDYVGIAIWGPILFILTSALILVELFEIRKFNPKLHISNLVVSVLVSSVKTGVALYSTVHINEDEIHRKVLGGILTFVSMCIMITSTFLAAHSFKMHLQRNEVLPPVVHFRTTQQETEDRL